MKLTVSKTAPETTRSIFPPKVGSLKVTATAKSAPAPNRGLIELPDLAVKFYTNDYNQLTCIELTTGAGKAKKVQKFEDKSPFINWGGLENHVDIYLSSIREERDERGKIVTTTLNRAQATKQKKRTTK
jgi:hypothetical protein